MRRKRAETVTHRGEAAAPAALALFIELVNAQGELPDVHDALHNAMDKPENSSTSPRDLWIRICGQIAAGLSRETRGFLGSAEALPRFLERYALLKSAREVLSGIAERYRGDPNAHCSSPSELMIHDEQFSAEVPFSVSVNLVINEHGRLAVSENPILNALRNVRADRIRFCAICSRIFWAPRSNSECCSERCRKTYNQRCSRENRRLRKRKRR